MNLGLEGKLIVVAGGAGDIGQATCKILSQEGAIIEVADKVDDVNLAYMDDVRPFFQNLRAKYDTIHGFVSLVYGGRAEGVADTSVARFEEVLRNTLHAAVYSAQESLRWMLEKGQGGHFVFVSSINSVLGLNEFAYDVAKAGLNQVARDIASAHGKDGIYAVTLCPGTVAPTRAWEGREESLEKIASVIPDGRVTTPEEVAHAIAFLLSEPAQMFSGHTLLADRGWSLRPLFTK